MSLSRRHLLKNLGVLAGGSVMVRLVSVATTLVVTRALGPTGFGVLSSGLAIAAVVGVCANLGLEDYVTRQVARAPERAAEALGEALVARLVAMPVAALAALALALAVPRAALVFACLIVYSLLHSYLLLVCAVFRGLQRMEAQSLLLGTQIVLIAGGAVGATALTHDPLPVAAAYLLATAATLGLTAWLLRRVGIHVCYSLSSPWRRVLRASAPFGLTAVGVVVYDRVGAVAVLALCGASAAGLFNAAYSLVLALTSLPSVAVAALYPSLAAMARGDRRALTAVSGRLVGAALAGGLLLALCVDLAGPTLVARLFGGAYLGAAAILTLLAWSLPPLFMTIVLVGILEAADRQRACAGAVGLALAVGAPASMAATWLWGLQGATAAYVLAHAVLAAMLTWLAAPIAGWIRPADAPRTAALDAAPLHGPGSG